MRLREIREAKGMSRGELYLLSGVSLREIERIETGEGEPLLRTAKKLAKALGVTLDELCAEPEGVHRRKAGIREAKNLIMEQAGEKGWAYREDLAVAAKMLGISNSTLNRAKIELGMKSYYDWKKADTVCVWAFSDTPDDVARAAVAAGKAARQEKRNKTNYQKR